MDSVELAQGTITYRVAGPDNSAHPPVVFVHGILVDNQLWNAVADLSPRGMVEIINGFMAELGLTDVTLVGNDTGGALCQFLIDTDHSRIGRLVLTNCAVRRDIAKLMREIRPKELLEVSTRLKSFTKPVRIVWGGADKSFKPSLGERLAAAFPNATFSRIDGGRTFVSMEFPDEVAEAIAKAS